MTFSVIVATKNRAIDLERMLPTLASQTRLPEELIIVDQSCGEDTRKVIESFARDLKVAGRREPVIVYLHNPTLVGAGAARNVGIERSRGDVLLSGRRCASGIGILARTAPCLSRVSGRGGCLGSRDQLYATAAIRPHTSVALLDGAPP